MRIEQRKWDKIKGWTTQTQDVLGNSPQLVLAFGSTSILKNDGIVDQLRNDYPLAQIIGCSTAGEICGTQVSDDSLVITAVYFEHTEMRVGRIALEKVKDSFDAGKCLAEQLDPEGLVHVLVFSDGLCVNGSDLARGLTQYLPEQVSVTGGLAGDGAQFNETLILSDGMPQRETVVVLGFYGSRLRIAFGSLGGWDPFGPERLITRSTGNVLYELDGCSALELYKKYLGAHSKGLPATGLLFPLSLRTRARDTAVVRTILAVNEEEQNMTFAGDVPEGSYARMMKANFDRLIDGAIGAARISYQAGGSTSPDLAVLISCVGRKLVLKQRVEEEVEGVQEVLGKQTILTGFYSYGEVCPFEPGAKSELHNQTMTITTFSEK